MAYVRPGGVATRSTKAGAIAQKIRETVAETS